MGPIFVPDRAHRLFRGQKGGDNTTTKDVCYHGALWTATGYGEAARNAVLALHSVGARVKVDPSGWASSTIQVSKGRISVFRHQTNKALKFPLELRELVERLRYQPVDKSAPIVIHAPSTLFERSMKSDRRNIGYTAWETSTMPPDWVAGCNLVDEVWIPSSHNQRILRDSGVTKPIFVIPHPIDINRFQPASYRLNGIFTFISVFRWGLRKGWPELVTAYERAFTADDSVILRILTNYRTAEHRAQAHSLIEHFKRPGKPRLEILPVEFVTYDMMPVIYQNADVFVLPSRGEGFCLPCAEAMACGLPAIVTDSTAFQDYISEANGYPVSYTTVAADDSTDPDRQATAWTVADIDELTELMRQAYDNADERLAKGLRARQTIETRFGFGQVAQLMMERIARNV